MVSFAGEGATSGEPKHFLAFTQMCLLNESLIRLQTYITAAPIHFELIDK